MKKLIPSKDVRVYLEKINYKFTDSEKATIIYNSSLTLEDKHREMRKIQANTSNKELQSQIQKRLEYDSAMLSDIKRGDDNCIFILQILDEEQKEYEEELYCTSYIVAEIQAKQYSGCFIIAKAHVLGEDESVDEFYNSEIARVYYDDSGRIKSYWKETKNGGDLSIKSGFEDAYISLPNPFQQGDIVAVVGTDKVGVVRKVISESQSNEGKNCTTKDYSDVSFIVEILDEEFVFQHEHINPIYLEYADLEGDCRKDILECASRLMKGNGSIEEFQMLCNK